MHRWVYLNLGSCSVYVGLSSSSSYSIFLATPRKRAGIHVWATDVSIILDERSVRLMCRYFLTRRDEVVGACLWDFPGGFLCRRHYSRFLYLVIRGLNTVYVPRPLRFYRPERDVGSVSPCPALRQLHINEGCRWLGKLEALVTLSDRLLDSLWPRWA
jgi:hypothetical protein